MIKVKASITLDFELKDGASDKDVWDMVRRFTSVALLREPAKNVKAHIASISANGRAILWSNVEKERLADLRTRRR